MRETRGRTNHVPRRTCIGCRELTTKDELVRCAYSEQTQEVVVDHAKRMPGRGAWIHPRESCLKKAVRSRGFHRALRIMDNGGRANVSVDITALEQGHSSTQSVCCGRENGSGLEADGHPMSTQR
ncbi:MAG TPA: YlxR family protein [Actinomyces sp.]|jgi:predicted RNA-binding protein YlxR (DUF448 family)|nr:YlxR family protein [Acidobacteriota bacterium]HHT40470.1 YlxR family protein [Actinomyces sp.]